MPTWRREMTTDWDTGNTKSKSDGLTKFFDSVKAVKFPRLFKLRAKEINNLIVMLNASILAKILLCMGILVTYKDYFGQEIDCNVPEQKTMSKAKIDDYCWSEGIFVVPDTPPYQTSYPGITSLQVTDSQKVYLRYYPWVHVSLIFQAVMFYQAKFIWICMQDEKIRKIFEKIVDKDVNIYELDELVRSNVVQRVADLLYTGGNFYYRVIMMEFTCMCHLFTHIWLTDLFLGGNFHSLGFKWLQYNHGLIRVDEDPLRKIFPREAKCSIKRFGYSGGIEVFDGQCYILMNNVVEKIYLALWLVYHLFLLINMCVLIWRMVIFMCPFIRLASLQQTGSPQAAKKYRKLCGNAGNWYILHLLSTHLTASYFMDLIDSVVAQHYDSKRRPIYRSRFAEKARKLKKKSPTTPLTMEISLANNANSNDRQEDDSNKKYEPGPPVPIVWDGKIDGLWPEN